MFKDLQDRIQSGAPISKPAGALLQAATLGPRIGMALRRFRKTHAVPAYIVSFGNITAGGTGKTPAVIERAEREVAAGHKVAVLTRGYGSTKTTEPLLLLPGEACDDMAWTFGDEPALIRARIPEVMIVKSADRVAGARMACDAGADVIILDDGYQSLRLHRDEDVLLVHAGQGFSNGYLLPRGLLREKPEAAGRATHIVLTRCDQVSAAERSVLESRLRELAPHAAIRRTWHRPVGLRCLGTGEMLPLAALRDQEVVAVSGIGSPESFARSLADLGAHVLRHVVYPDHAPIPPEAFGDKRRIVTTEKDAVRSGCTADHVWALVIELADFSPEQDSDYAAHS